MNASLVAIVERFPAPADDGKLGGPDKDKMDAAVSELLEMGPPGIIGLVDMLANPEKAGDSRVRHALHAVATRAGTLPEEKRREVARSFAATLDGDAAKEAKGFVVWQLQVCGGQEVLEPLAKLLADEELCSYAAQALAAIGGGANEILAGARNATGTRNAKGAARLAIVAALAASPREKGTWGSLISFAQDDDVLVRRVALSGLAKVGNANDSDVRRMLDAAKGEGYDRTIGVRNCLVFAERLLAQGVIDLARRVYEELSITRDASEGHIREAARLGLVACDVKANAKDGAGDFRDLFNAKDLSNWQDPSGGVAPTGWLVKDRAMILTDGAGDIWTKERFGDFVLSLEFRTTGNSGIFIRTDKPTDSVQTGIEIQVDNPSKNPGKHSCGAVYDLVAPSKNAAMKDQWNRVVITAKDSKLNVVMNGEAIIDMDLDQWTNAGQNPDGSKNKFRTALKDFKREGHIGFQDHGAEVMYRNVRIKAF